MHEQQLTSGLLRNIAPMMATFCNTWNMHCIKWICSSPPFGSIESIHATRTNSNISPFQSSMPSLTIHSHVWNQRREMKAAYKWIVKEHFPRIKKHADFQEQITRGRRFVFTHAVE